MNYNIGLDPLCDSDGDGKADGDVACSNGICMECGQYDPRPPTTTTTTTTTTSASDKAAFGLILMFVVNISLLL